MAPNTIVCTLAVVTVALLSLESHGFALEKKKVENKLNAALNVIERKKRHVDFRESEDEGDDLAWGPRDVDLYDWEQQYPSILQGRYENSFDLPALRDLYADRYLDEQNPPLNAYDWNALLGQDVEGNEDVENAIEDEGEARDESETPVSNEELQDIFQSVDNKENAQNPANTNKREYDPSQIDKRDEDEEGLTQDEVNELLSGADEALVDALSSSSDSGENSVKSTPVTDAEINNIFQNKEGKDTVDIDKPEIDTEDKGGETTGEALDKEWLSQYIMNGAPSDGEISTKKKRSSWHTYPSPTSYGLASGANLAEDRLEDLTNDLEIAKADVKILKNFLALEDEENANLAKALNLATKSQTERTDKYVKDEIHFIKDAINDEVDLQEIKDVLQIAQSLRESNPDDFDEEPTEEEDEDLESLDNALEKRGYPGSDISNVGATDLPLEDLEEVDEEVPAESDIEDEDDVDESTSQISSDDLVNILLANKLRDMLTRNNGEALNEVFGKDDDVQSLYNVPALENTDDKEYYINPLMRELYEKLQVQNSNVDKRSQTGYDDNFLDADNLDEGNGLSEALLDALADSGQVCPAVEQLTDNCEFMADIGLGLDKEATDLCNRHQMCYTCGAALGLEPNDCDRGYLAEAAMLCAEEDGCDEDAAGLFIIMLKYHSFQPLSRIPDQCGDTCAEEYIAGRFDK